MPKLDISRKKELENKFSLYYSSLVLTLSSSIAFPCFFLILDFTVGKLSLYRSIVYNYMISKLCMHTRMYGN